MAAKVPTEELEKLSGKRLPTMDELARRDANVNHCHQ